ncbi:hypothetical protein [Massilia sp. DWR3-1-1]|uniref:hypothetical protein n=1 Tax=Massilia sp. DWR3-1-1 TaxID=2804559 RepID=UPI003CEC4818
MTFTTFLRPVALAAIALTLAACGGKATFTIGGTVTSLSYPGLVLTTNGMDLSVPAGATSFSFPNTVSYGDVYNVTQKTPPLHQSCTTVSPLTGVDTASGTAGRTASIAIVVTCLLNTYSIGGAVSGLAADGLVLTNGSSGTIAVASGVTAYAFTDNVPYNTSYGITVLTQPTNQVCTVSNPAGVMGDAAVTNINVTCVTKPAST